MKIVGNGSKATLLILVFIVILCALSYRCSAADQNIDLLTGVSFGPSRSAPVLGLNIEFPRSNNVTLYAGTLLWGNTAKADTNWDWHTGFRTCRNRFCANIGASYVQRIDAVTGSHTNFNLGLSYELGWRRVQRVSFFHLSNAGTTMPNLGRNAALVDWRLQ